MLIWVSLNLCPRVYIDRSQEGSIFSALRNFYTGFHSGWINIHSHQQCYKEPQARILTCIFVSFLDDSCSDWDEKESLCGFELHFPGD